MIFSKLSRTKKILLAIGFQVLIVLGLVGFKLWVLHSGTEVVLRIQPVDPRDILRGDYVTFQYTDFSEVQGYLFAGSVPQKGRIIYIPLRRAGKYWVPDYGITYDLPQNDLGTVYLKGRVVEVYNGSSFRPPALPQCVSDDPNGCPSREPIPDTYTGQRIRIAFGIEEYFIPEGKGQNVDFTNDAAAVVAVSPDGSAVLKQIFVDGSPWP